MSNRRPNDKPISEVVRALLEDPRLSGSERKKALRELRAGRCSTSPAEDVVIRLLERIRNL